MLRSVVWAVLDNCTVAGTEAETFSIHSLCRSRGRDLHVVGLVNIGIT